MTRAFFPESVSGKAADEPDSDPLEIGLSARPQLSEPDGVEPVDARPRAQFRLFVGMQRAQTLPGPPPTLPSTRPGDRMGGQFVGEAAAQTCTGEFRGDLDAAPGAAVQRQ